MVVTMNSVSALCVAFLLCSLSEAELLNNEITEQREARPEIVNVPEQPEPCPSDVHAVLREMSVKLAVLQTKMEQVQILNQEQVGKLRDLEKQMSQVDTLKLQQEVQNFEMGTMKQKQQVLAADLMSIKTWANVTEHNVASLRKDRAVAQVAFSASLLESGAGYTGPFNTHTILVFRHVISNIGNAYNPNTGFFIAPVKGAYHFEFYIGSWSEDYHRSAVALVKNGEHVVLAHERGPNGHSSAANGATLLLEPGDVVFLRLLVNHNIYDDQNHYSTFSGHLLFSM